MAKTVKAVPVTWKNIRVRLGDLKPWAGNPRLSTKAQAKRLLESWAKFGQVQTVAVGPNLEVYDGHQRLSALLTMHGRGYVVDARQSNRALTDQERRELAVTLHAGATGSWDWDVMSGWDPGELVDWGMGLDLFDELKRDAAALGELLESERGAEGVADAEPQMDKAEELRAKWGTELGQLWELDSGKGHPHRMICGDCTDPAVVERVMGGEKAAAVVTDPPYAILGGGTFAAGKGIEVAFDRQFFRAWFASLLATLNPFLADGASQWMTIDWRGATAIEEAVVGSRWRMVGLGVWYRGGLGMGYAMRKTYENFALLVAKGWQRFKTDEPDVWDHQWTPGDRTEGHAAEKPAELMQRAIELCGGEIVLDPFAGSGTTLVACQNLGRQCRAIEISPAYCAVILQRMADSFPELNIELSDSDRPKRKGKRDG